MDIKYIFVAFMNFSLLYFSLLCSQANAALLSTNAGQISGSIITSREVMMNHLVEIALFKDAKKMHTNLDSTKVREAEFVRETTSVLLETAIYFEAESFSLQGLSPAELNSYVRRAQKKLEHFEPWKRLEVEPKELTELIKKKIKAKNFIRFKVDSGVIPITDREAEDYFVQNKFKFENLPFSNFKENIKKYLGKQQIDKRMKDWFELIQSKYKVRNYLSE